MTRHSIFNSWTMGLAAIVIAVLFLRTPSDRGIAVGEYDGQQNYFEVSWGNTTNVTEVNSLWAVQVRVSNSRESGGMYVRCRIVSRNMTWLPGNLTREASLTYLPTSGTCLNDAYGQTARAVLDTGENILVPFTLITPNTPDLWAISCMTIERCWKNSTPDGTDMRSDQKAFLINITPRSVQPPIPINATYLCSLDQDCEVYNLFGPQRCISGRCVDRADLGPIQDGEPPTGGGTTTETTWRKMTDWVHQHKTASVLGIAALVLVGIILLRRKKRR